MEGNLLITNDSQIESIQRIIYGIRGQKVMLDSDLAMLYGVETRSLNQAVKRNIDRFPVDFMFQLTRDEWLHLNSSNNRLNQFENEKDTSLTSQNVILKKGRGQHKKYMPYVFTQNGIAMLSSVLRSDTAIGVNIRIMRAFTSIPQMVNYNTHVIQRIFNLEQHQLDTDEKIDAIMNKIEDFSPKSLPEQVFQTGCVWDAWTYVANLVRSARQRIVLVDNYVDDRVLSMLAKRDEGVSATIYTRYSKQFVVDLNKHNVQYSEIHFVQLSHRNHDRFLIIDDKVYLLGASLKDIGVGLCAVTMMSAAPASILELVK